MDEYISSLRVSPEFEQGNKFMISWNDIWTRQKNRDREVVRQLRDMGIKAVHHNDGLVKRNEGVPYEVHFCYPDFIEIIHIGDKIALKGWDKELSHECVSIYEVTDIRPWNLFFQIDPKYVSYKIKHINKRYLRYEDGRLELVDNSKSARCKRWLLRWLLH